MVDKYDRLIHSFFLNVVLFIASKEFIIFINVQVWLDFSLFPFTKADIFENWLFSFLCYVKDKKFK